MRLLLREPVRALGEPGDEVNVRAGYARNYLLPRRIAVPITEDNRREVAEARQAWAVRQQREREAAAALAEVLEGHSLTFERRVKTDTDELYGSVSIQDIARELAADGFEIPRNRILLAAPIKRLGEQEVTIRLHPELEVRLGVEVTPVATASFGAAPEPAYAEPSAESERYEADGLPETGEEVGPAG